VDSARVILLVAAKELRDAWSNRWFALFTAAFAILALALAWIGVAGLLGSGVAGFGRTAASLVNLTLLVVPLMGLLLGAASVAGERDRGSLLYLLAQPVSPWEVVTGKFLGLLCAVSASLLLGFGGAAAVLASRGSGGDVGSFLAFLCLAVVVGAAALSIGLAISVQAPRGSAAVGIALFAWVALVVLGDLGLMGTALVLDLSGRTLLAALVVNPLQAFKVATLKVLHGGLETLGPAGLWAQHELGDAIVPALVGILLLWVVLPVAWAAWTLQRKGALT